MARTVYTERFLHGRATGVEDTYVVPAGHRAVVRCCVIQNFAAVATYQLLRVDGAPVVYVQRSNAMSSTCAPWPTRANRSRSS